MALPQIGEARKFYQAAKQRFDDAEFLLQKGDRRTAAVYLAGYGVECMLKALILSNTPETARTRILRELHGQKAHSFDWLREQYFKKGVPGLPRDVARGFRTVSTWSTDMRYEPGRGELEESVSFLQAAETIIRWADGRI
jgi:HEPN domain-containing protein